MTLNLIKKTVALLIVVFAFTGCEKKGCTDADAENYDANATKEDNGSCLYGIDMTFYMSEWAAEAFTDAGGTPPLSLEIGSPTIATKSIGSINWEEDSVYAADPECGSTDPFIFNLRYQDYTKGESTAVLTGTYGDGSSAYSVGLTVNLGSNGCVVRSF